MKDVFDRDEVNEVLRDDFYVRAPAEPGRRGRPADARSRRRGPGRGRPRRPHEVKPDHYSVICISLYNEDLQRLDTKVAELKAGGHRKMSRSALIRFALDTMDTSRLPRSY